MDPLEQEYERLSAKTSNPWYHDLASSPIVRGGVIGAFVTTIISWNNNRHGKIGSFLKRWHFIRYFVSAKPAISYCPITNYHLTHLDIASNNFYCYSGSSGIGKSRHFQAMVSRQSHIRPSLYISFKGVGRQNNFQNDLSQQVHHTLATTLQGGIIGQLVRAIKRIHEINTNPQKFIKQYLAMNLVFVGMYAALFHVSILIYFQPFLLYPLFAADCYYFHFLRPLLHQARRRTIPLVVFDDLNKLEHLGMLGQMTRLFKILELKSANLMMISSNQETWSKLRRQPGMKDRLRVRHIKYDHQQSAKRILQLIQNNPKMFQNYFNPHPLFSLDLIKILVKTFIQNKQMTIRRFSSMLKLVDQEQYEELVGILQNQDHLLPQDIVDRIEEVIFHTQTLKMVVNLRSVKRQLPQMNQKQYLCQLQKLLRLQKLPSDSRVGAVLKIYNITRDLRSQYVINGGYILKVFELAYFEYNRQINEYLKQTETVK